MKKLRDFRLPPRCRTDLNCCLIFTQRRVVIMHRRFGTTYRYHLEGSRSPSRIKFLTLGDGTDVLFRNSGAELPLYAA
jgi:hypothetical protein